MRFYIVFIFIIINSSLQSQVCADVDMDVRHLVKVPKATKANPSKVISIYLETDLYTRNQLGSDAATEQWLREVYMGVAVMYGNEGISTALTGTFWPANSSQDWSNGLIGDSFGLLNTFGLIRQNEPAGRLKQFVSMAGSQVGLGWIGVLQADYFTFVDNNVVNHAGPFAFSLGMNSPSYWNIYAATHEMGHNIGATHTHSCNWGNGNQVLDLCASNQCNNNLSPNAEDDTVMSYCGNTNILTNGFGLEPGNFIRSAVSQATIDLSGGHCAKILYLADEIDGDYYATEDVIFHPGLDTDGMCVFVGCP